jgi:DNA-binding transcriptional LysR family regulator
LYYLNEQIRISDTIHHLKRMELYHLRTFITVAQEGHLTRAAERLCLSQPAVSAHVKNLEDELGVILFERTPTGMRLTEEGHLLEKQAKKALATIDALQQQAKNFAGDTTEVVRLGIHIDPRFLKIGEFLSSMSNNYPHLKFQFHQGMSWNILDDIKEDRLDGGYVFSEDKGDKIRFLRLRTSQVYIVGPAQWKDRMTTADWKQIARLPWIGAPDDCPFHQIATGLFQQKNLKPFKVAVADHEALHHALVSAGIGLTLMVEEEAFHAEAQGTVVRWGEPVADITLSFAYLKKRESDPALQAVLSALRAVWEGCGG